MRPASAGFGAATRNCASLGPTVCNNNNSVAKQKEGYSCQSPRSKTPPPGASNVFEDHIATIFKALAAVAVTQAKTAEHVDILTVKSAETQNKLDALILKSAETQDKLDALIHMWDNWIKGRGAKNGAPTPEPPSAA